MPVIQAMRPKRTNLATISQLTGLAFPRDAVLLDSQFKKWIEAEIWARVEIRRSSLDTFLQGSHLHISSDPSDRALLDRDPYTAPPAWWQPQSADTFILAYRVISRTPIHYTALLADLGEADDEVVLYLHWRKD